MVTDARRTSIPKATIVAAECPDCLLVKGSAPGVAYAWPDGLKMCVDCACVDVRPISDEELARDPAYADDGDGWPGGLKERVRLDGVLVNAALSIVLILGSLTLLGIFVLIANALAGGN